MPRVRPTATEAAHQVREPQAKRDLAMIQHYRAAFGTESGQIVLAHLLRRCGVLAASPNEQTEGARRVGLMIIRLLDSDEAGRVAFQLTSNTEELFNERNAAE